MKYCQFCAESIQIEAIKCRYCGEFQTDSSADPDESTASTRRDALRLPVAPDDITAPRHTIGMWQAIAFPFRQDGWFRSLWWVVLLGVVPFLNVVFLRGWRLSIMRRMATGTTPVLPPREGIMDQIGDGVILSITWFIYRIPAIVVSVLFSYSALFLLIDIIWWLILRIFTDNPIRSIYTVMGKGLLAVIMELGAPLIILSILGPMYMAGTLLYAKTHKARSFFRIIAIVRLLLNDPGGFIWVYFLEFLIATLMVTIGIPVMLFVFVTGAGNLVQPIIVAIVVVAIIWTSGYLNGALCLRLQEKAAFAGLE